MCIGDKKKQHIRLGPDVYLYRRISAHIGNTCTVSLRIVDISRGSIAVLAL